MTTVRGEIRRLLARARQARGDGYETPVVASPEEAERVTAAIVAQMAHAVGDERLACLAALAEIDAALSASIAHAQTGMDETARQLIEARRGSDACRSYAAAGGPERRLN